MEREKSKITASFGLLFLVIGIVWLSCLFIREEGYLPKKPKQLKKPTTYSAIYHKAHKRITLRLRPLPVSRHMPKAFILHFWTIVVWELLCALAYLLSGIFLLRAYPFGWHVVVYTLSMDIILKVLIGTYHYYILLPLKVVFQKTNIMFSYFIPDSGLASKISSGLTGIKLTQPGALYYAIPYGIFLLISFYFFIRPKMKMSSSACM